MKKTDNEKIQRLDVSQTHIDHFSCQWIKKLQMHV